jgi:ABC-type multidrug transport system fused ATPase/permease subunit
VNRLLEGRTGIIIAHRLETVERVDKIMVLADGQIVEFGPRAELATNAASWYSGLLRISANQEADSGLDEHLERLSE